MKLFVIILAVIVLLALLLRSYDKFRRNPANIFKAIDEETKKAIEKHNQKKTD